MGLDSRNPSCASPGGVCSRKFRFGGDEHWVLSFSLAPLTGGALTSAELAIADAILDGASNREIAEGRGRSVNTVANQVAALYKKLGVRSRQELVVSLARRSRADADAFFAGGVNARLRWFARAVLSSAAQVTGSAEMAALATGAWKIIDHFDADGRRYVIACRAPAPLTADERVLVRRRARGDSVKEIAIDLGVSSATISRRLARTLHKLGLASHAELPRLFALSPAWDLDAA